MRPNRVETNLNVKITVSPFDSLLITMWMVLQPTAACLRVALSHYSCKSLLWPEPVSEKAWRKSSSWLPSSFGAGQFIASISWYITLGCDFTMKFDSSVFIFSTLPHAKVELFDMDFFHVYWDTHISSSRCEKCFTNFLLCLQLLTFFQMSVTYCIPLYIGKPEVYLIFLHYS